MAATRTQSTVLTPLPSWPVGLCWFAGGWGAANGFRFPTWTLLNRSRRRLVSTTTGFWSVATEYTRRATIAAIDILISRK